VAAPPRAPSTATAAQAGAPRARALERSQAQATPAPPPRQRPSPPDHPPAPARATSAGRPPDAAARRPAERSNRPIFIAAGVIAAIAIVVLVVTQLGGGSSPTATRSGTAGSNGSAAGAAPARANTTVAVLNGTAVPGLASQVAVKLVHGGFKRGQVTNAADQQRTQTTVQYATGARQPADEVARILGVGAVTPLDANTQAIAGPDAQIVVTVGSDRAR
jgi:hypothetical protein